MSAFKNRFVPAGIGMLLGASPLGCQQPQPPHRMADLATGTKLACQLCYDEAVKVRTGPPKHRYYKTIVKHRCPECFADMEVYEDGGKSMIKCGHCAPGGVACDKCLPPSRAAK